MRRRTFLSLAGAATAYASLAAACERGAREWPVGYQLFSVRDAMASDPLGTLTALRDMGYRHFEGYGYDADADRLYGMPPATLADHLAALGTPMTSAHFGFAAYLDPAAGGTDALRRYTDACLGAAEALGLDYLVWPVVPAAYRTADGYARLAESLNVIGEQLAGSGRQLAFHNNGGEFAPLPPARGGDGARSGYDIVLAGTDPARVRLQLDMYWLAHDDAGLTPAEIVARAPGRVELWHVKDMHPASRDYTELGAGTLDYAALLPDPAASGLRHLYLEQGGNYASDSMASAETNVSHWRNALAGQLAAR